MADDLLYGGFRGPGGFMPLGSATGPLALWDLTTFRFFFLDGDAGNDANIGYIDAAPGTVFTPADTTPVAVKTTSRLEAIIPLIGAGRSWYVLAKPRASGAIYDHLPGDGQGRHDRSKLTGYARMIFRGSDLTNNAADKIRCGSMVGVAGPNGDGSFTIVGSGASALWNNCLDIDVAAGAFGLAREMGRYRVRVEDPAAPGVTVGLGMGRWNDAALKLTIWDVSLGAFTPGFKFWLEVPGTTLQGFDEAPEAVASRALWDAGLGMMVDTPAAATLAGVRFRAGAVAPQYSRLGLHDGLECAEYSFVADAQTPGDQDLTFQSNGMGGRVQCKETYHDESNLLVATGLGIAANILLLDSTQSADISFSHVEGASVLRLSERLLATRVQWFNIGFNATPNGAQLVENDFKYAAFLQSGNFDIQHLTAIVDFSLDILPSDVQRISFSYMYDPTGICAATYPLHFLVGPCVGFFNLDNPVIGLGIQVDHFFGGNTVSMAVTWDSLRATGFEIEGFQKLVTNNSGDTTCPRGVPMRRTQYANGVKPVGLVVRYDTLSTPDDGDRFVEADTASLAGYTGIIGVTLTNCTNDGWAVIGNDGFMAIRYDVGQRPLPGEIAYLSDILVPGGTCRQTAPATVLALGNSTPLLFGGALGQSCVVVAWNLRFSVVAPPPASQTLLQTYDFGAIATDQTLTLLDVKGGGVSIDGTNVGFTGPSCLTINSFNGSFWSFQSDGSFVGGSNMTGVSGAAVWNALSISAPSLVLTGGPGVDAVLQAVSIGQGQINGPGNTITDAYNCRIAAAPFGTATQTRSWSFGVVGAVQLAAGLVLGTGFLPPTENDLVVGAGAVVVSEANSGRLGYIAGASQQFYVSLNTGAYVPLLMGPAAGGFTTGSVPFGVAGGQLSQDNATFFWDNTNKRLGVGATPTATLHVVQQAIAAGVPTAFVLTSGAHTNITLSTEDIGVDFNLSATKQWATGALATQREVVFRAPTYAFVAASTITTAATVAITGAPIAGAGPTTITNPLAFWVQSGSSRFSGTVGINTTIAPQAQLEIVTGTFVAADVAGNATNGGALKLTSLGGTGPEAVNGLEFENSANILGFGIGGGAKLFVEDGNRTFGIAVRYQATAWTKRLTIGEQYGNTTIGGANKPANACSVQLIGTPSAFLANTAAAGLTWDGVTMTPGTFVITGATTPITELIAVKITAPTINATSAVVTTDVFTCRILAPLYTGSASATRSWSLGIDGNTKFGGGQNIKGTDVNAAGPYVVLATDYVVEVRYTATGAISLNLPSIATVGNGHIVIVKDSGYNAAINNITLVRNGADTIENVAGNYVQNVSGSCLWLKANTTTSNWEIV